jgi:hypothetical protein
MHVLEKFRDGGWGMYPTLVFGVMLLVVAVRYAKAPDRRVVPLLVALNVLTLSAGALGFVSGTITVATALSGAGIAEPSRIAFEGIGESLNNVAFALMFVMFGAMTATLGAWKLSKPYAARAGG